MKILIVADEKSIKPFSQDGSSLLQLCYEMFASEFNSTDILVQIPESIKSDVTSALPDANLSVEPVKRGTAPAVGLATMRIAKENPDEIIAVVYSDHPVSYKNRLLEALKSGEAFNNNLNRLFLIAVNPTFPATNYGYVKIGKVLQDINGTMAFEMVDFKEKPDQRLANEFISSWRYLWNTGYMIHKASEILEIYKEVLPDVYKGLMTIKESMGSDIEKQITDTVYSSFKKISIDKGIYENIDREKVGIIPVDLHIHDFEARG